MDPSEPRTSPGMVQMMADLSLERDRLKDLVFDDVSFAYTQPDGTKRTVLDHFSARFPDRLLTLISGPSGSGKTTLFRLAAGLIKPDSGTITGFPEEGAGILFQDDRLFPHLNVLQNLLLCAPERTEEELREMLSELEIADVADQYPDTLSGGQSRRAAILRAAAVDRPLYLLDEPFNGLDPETRDRTAAWLMNRLRGRTVLLITHVEAEGMEGEKLMLRTL
ncbi:MAG: ATP-binding cassette domain-containing protein [Firmicutes bacterium]|nr:ATP-binding cassette domain-containing protein [Bacillota bacterium]